MKARQVILTIFLILLADQALKFYIKLNYLYGEEHLILGDWFRLHFVENEGMAWGWSFGGEFGKIALTLFRLAAVIFGVFYIRTIIRNKEHKGFIICAALIFAGALGNLIDSMFYGLIFEESSQTHVSRFMPPGGGYASFLHGRVVDMLHFPMFEGVFPSWVPFWGGESFVFFNPVFNIADASISIGVIALLIFQKKFFGKHHHRRKAFDGETEVSKTGSTTVVD
ncbi:MAG TPA: lipoprotein signal peptidase [Chitinophagaceae bacterium]